MVVLILYQYDIKYVTKCNTKFKKCRKYGTLRVDLTGVEPVSKNQSPVLLRAYPMFLHSLCQTCVGTVPVSVASSYARRLKALPASFLT